MLNSGCVTAILMQASTCSSSVGRYWFSPAWNVRSQQVEESLGVRSGAPSSENARTLGGLEREFAQWTFG